MTRLSRVPSSVTLNTPKPVSAETKILRLTLTLNDANLSCGRTDRRKINGVHRASLREYVTRGPLYRMAGNLKSGP